MDDNGINLNKETEWYENNKFNKNHFLNSKMFFSSERNSHAYIFPKKMLLRFIRQKISLSFMVDAALEERKVLIAPFGRGDDLRYVRNFPMISME